MIKVLESEWKKLIDIKESGSEVPTIFQRNLFYKCRTITIQKYTKEDVCDYAYFKYELIYKLEDKFGYSREELGIRAKPDATISTRNGLTLIEYEHRLVPVVCVIATEKSGIAESLAEYLTNYGIYIIDTTGNQGRYPLQLVERYGLKGIPIFCIEDLDITGCFMSERFKKVNAERINLLDIAKILEVNPKDLWEEDIGGIKNKHFPSIPTSDKKLLLKKGKYRRIEIDTLMDYSGSPEKFATAILNFLDKKILTKNMSKVMELGEWVYVPLIPKKDMESIEKNIENLEKKYESKRKRILYRYKNLRKSFFDLSLENLENEAKDKFEEIVMIK